MTRIGLVGDRDDSVVAHRAIPRAIALAAAALGRPTHAQWVATESVVSDDLVEGFDGVWCVPASPYRSTDGALRAIRSCRERGRPFLGTCGGFQHAILEYARTVLGWADAGHAEIEPGAGRPVIAPLACGLVEARANVRLREDSKLGVAYGAPVATEAYHCRYGLNPAFRDAIACGPLRVSAEDEAGEVRAVELDAHPFFVATLFQPERAALEGRLSPPVVAFVRAAATSHDARHAEAPQLERGGIAG